MPTGNLPAEGKALWENVYDKALKGSCEGDKECASRTAWSAVKGAGWSKDSDGNWHKKSVLQEFSLYISKASYDKKTQQMRWYAVASDVEDDTFEDNMTESLFDDFARRIESKESPPERFRSEFWNGGLPYISISHYPDLNGKAVPGKVEDVYKDGNRLKARGHFYDTPLGRACFRSLCKDFYPENENDLGSNERIRISIAFLDYSHRHKSNGYLFERTEEEPICFECLREDLAGTGEGLEFLKGHLIHLALTRVPANARTLIEPMEVDKMAIKTRKDDALSIVGEDEEAKSLIEEIADESKLVGKSELVIKSDSDEEPSELVEEAKHEDEAKDDEEDEEDEKPVVEKKSMADELQPVLDELRPVLDALAELKSIIADVKSAPEVPAVVVEPHPLDAIIGQLKSAFDNVTSKSNVTPDTALQQIQEPFNAFGSSLVEIIRSAVPEPVPDPNQSVLDQMALLNQKIAELSAKLESRSEASNDLGQLRRRSLTPPPVTVPQTPLQKRPGGVKSVAEIVDATT